MRVHLLCCGRLTGVGAGRQCQFLSSFHPLYSEGHRTLQEGLSKFIADNVNPHVDGWESAKHFPAKQLFKQLAPFGVFGADKPTAYGGLALDFSYSLAIAETLGEISCGGIPMAVCVQSEMATPALSEFGSDSLKREFLAPSISGDRIACIGVSEPGGGSDVAATRTRLARRSEDWVISGCKTWITNGHQADWCCLLASSDCSSDPHRNKSLVCVDLREPGNSMNGQNEDRLGSLEGVRLGRPIQKLGMHCSDTAQIFFDEVRVPSGNIIGEEGAGFRYQMRQFQNERLVSAAVVLRPLDRILRLTTEYALSRPLFGARVFDQQTVKYRLAALSAQLDALRALLYQTAAQKVRGEDVTVETSKAKYLAGQLARRIPDACLQFWGGVGYTWECEVSRMFRDLRLISIGAGCDEVMLAIVAKQMEQMAR